MVTSSVYLIVSADDFGLSESVNRGIIEAYSAGAIRSAGLMATGAAFDDAIRLSALNPGLDLGVHLCLDEESPVLPADEIPSLVDAHGNFHCRSTLLKKLLLTRELELDEVKREFTAQFQRCLDAGARLSHFDGHGHVHVYPRIAKIGIEVARRFGVLACRMPSENIFFIGSDFRFRAYVNKCIVTGFSGWSRHAFRAAGMVYPDAFLGMSYGGRITPALIDEMLERMPTGRFVELMTHPGHYDQAQLSDYWRWDYDWEKDLEAVKSLGVHFAAQRRDEIQDGLLADGQAVRPSNQRSLSCEPISFSEFVAMSTESEKMRNYWDDAIIAWEKSSYDDGARVRGEGSLIENMAGRLRGHIRERQASCLNHLGNKVSDKVVVELGCATGSSCFALLDAGARKVIGLDISERAVTLASNRVAELGIDPERISFYRFACGEPFPFEDKVDLVFGLGIVEYIRPESFFGFVKSIGANSIYFSFDEKRINLQKALHFFYRKIKAIPFYRMYSQDEIVELLGPLFNSEIYTYREGRNAFVTNLK